jgi:negative regulator of flagellin synthesis FlgM
MEIKKTGHLGMYGQIQLERPENKTGINPTSTQSVAAPKADTVSVSDEAILRTEAYRTAMHTQDIRQEKIEAIKAQIADGTYEVDSRKIAAAILDMEKAMQS